MAPHLAELLNTELDADLIDSVARAGYATWLHNGHDVLAALEHAAMHAEDPAVRHAAAEAHAEAISAPLVAGAFRVDFAARLRAEQDAQHS